MFMLAAAIAWVSAGFLVQAKQETKPGQQPFNDTSFVQKVASGCKAEVMLGKIAEQQGKNEAVKKYGERLVNDHTKANEQLMKVAQSAGIQIPEKMDEHCQHMVDTFKDYKGTNFDSDFIKSMVTDHEKCIALFTQASKEAKNPAVKEWATETLPVLKTHLEIAKKIQSMQ
jgi:putative membrane protein